MTAVPATAGRLPRQSPGRRIALVAVAALVWAMLFAGVGDGIVNTGGWSSFAEFSMSGVHVGLPDLAIVWAAGWLLWRALAELRG